MHCSPTAGAIWPPFSKLPGNNKAFGIRHKYLRRELGLEWLAGYDQWEEEHHRLIETSKDCSVSAGETGATTVRLKQFGPYWGTETLAWHR